jgi:hypothetical protein
VSKARNSSEGLSVGIRILSAHLGGRTRLEDKPRLRSREKRGGQGSRQEKEASGGRTPSSYFGSGNRGCCCHGSLGFLL